MSTYLSGTWPHHHYTANLDSTQAYVQQHNVACPPYQDSAAHMARHPRQERNPLVVVIEGGLVVDIHSSRAESHLVPCGHRHALAVVPMRPRQQQLHDVDVVVLLPLSGLVHLPSCAASILCESL